MNPIVMALLLVVGWGIFAYSAWRRWNLLLVGAPENRFDNPGARLAAVWTYAVAQLRMRRYPLAGYAHMIIFFGFLVLLLRSLILWGRGFYEPFDFWVFGTDQLLGQIYSLLKDIFVVLVFLAALVFVYYRMIARLPRLTLSGEGLLIIWIIVVMMGADVLYDGAQGARHTQTAVVDGPITTPRKFPGEPKRREVITWADVKDEQGNVIGRVPTSTYRDVADDEWKTVTLPVRFHWYEPAGSMAAVILHGLPDGALNVFKHIGFWGHVALVLIFLNLLPYSKHFHVITAIPNVYTKNLYPPGRLPPIADIDGRLEREETLGVKRIDQFTWKAMLDFYTCTECGRCTDQCPAHNTGKKLSPKQFTLDLRDFLYKHGDDLVASKVRTPTTTIAESEPSAGSEPQPPALDAVCQGSGSGPEQAEPRECHKDLVDGVIDPEVLWACTSCRACEQECPVCISYVDKIVDMRRYLVQERGEFAAELQTAFRCLEASFNPWGFPADERAKWAEGLDIKTLADHPDAAVLFWVGCAPAFDDRAKKVTRATAQLMQKAGIDFAILGNEEQCTGDVARRAGNEYLFQMFARQNVETLNRYGAEKKTIVTVCPHCYNTLQNEYPDFDGHYYVVHHTKFLADLLAQGKLKPVKRIDKRVAFHDSCYLGRYNEMYDEPREVLRRIPGLTLVEPRQTRDRGMCCGAGGAQMFKEEEKGDQRVNIARAKQLLDTSPDTIASACPFCMRMLIDGLADQNREDVPQLDIAEILLEAVGPT